LSSTWREAVDADRRRRPRPAGNQREQLRRLTVTVAAAAAVVNAGLFIDAAASQVSAGDVDGAIIAAISSLMPGSVHPVSTPTPPVVVTGAS
jgi:hypothetical protein